MRNLLRLIAAVCSLLGIGCTDATARHEGNSLASSDVTPWQVFTSSDGRYSILMPGNPQALPVEEGLVSYAAELPDGYAFVVTYSDEEVLEETDAESVLEDFRDGTTRKGRLIDDQPVTVYGHRGRDFSRKDEEGRIMHFRAFLVDHRMYVLGMSSSMGDNATAREHLRRFLGSFTLLE